MSLTQYCLKMPKAVYSGCDSINNLSQIAKSLHSKKIAAFTSAGLRKPGLFNLVEDQISKIGIAYEVFDNLPAEPAYMQVQEVIDQFKTSGCDLIVACGGGSVMDTAKLASVLVTDEYSVKDLLDNPQLAKKCIPLIMIPTTAGTGAECTPNAIVGVPEKELKIGIVNENLIADYVILDARMIKDLPRSIAAATGIDAMCHAIECYTSKKANPFSDTFALEAFDLIMNNIEKACDDPQASEAKNNMQIAAFYGGVAITASGTTAVHALSYPLGGKYHMAHGVSNAMLLVPVMKFNEPIIRPLLAKAWDKAWHGNHQFEDDKDKSMALIDWMERIVRHLEIPTDLKQFGVDPADLDDLVEAGMSVQRLLVNNMRDMTAEDARRIYQEVMHS